MGKKEEKSNEKELAKHNSDDNDAVYPETIDALGFQLVPKKESTPEEDKTHHKLPNYLVKPKTEEAEEDKSSNKKKEKKSKMSTKLKKIDGCEIESYRIYQ